jgi:hypothetical protein
MRPNYDLDDTSTGVHSAVIRSAGQAARVQRSHPLMLRRGPLFMLWLMLRRREPRRSDRPCESHMPPGCALVMRYHSR